MLAIKDLSVEFMTDHKVKAVDRVSLNIRKGTNTTIIGETGSGKSVLILSILRLLPPSAKITGKVIFENSDLFQMSKKETELIRGRKISYIPQGSGNALNPLLIIGYQVAEPMIVHKMITKKQAPQRSIDLLKRFNLGNEERRIHDYPHTLSGGMKQRVLVAMGISAGAGLILADEPTKGLDKSRVFMVVDCFQQLKSETILCVTHDLDFAQVIGDYVAVMYAAQIVEYSKKDDFFSKPLHPYSEALINSMPENGLKALKGFAPPHDTYSYSGCRFFERCSFKSDRCRSDPPLVEFGIRQVRCWKYAD
ncbi:MAG: ABC transporter ATP-binding protein [Chloroflexi bacterium]|nr:ABC transporter ATP-binding protein [Chloroflexota bacterium]